MGPKTCFFNSQIAKIFYPGISGVLMGLVRVWLKKIYRVLLKERPNKQLPVKPTPLAAPPVSCIHITPACALNTAVGPSDTSSEECPATSIILPSSAQTLVWPSCLAEFVLSLISPEAIWQVNQSTMSPATPYFSKYDIIFHGVHI